MPIGIRPLHEPSVGGVAGIDLATRRFRDNPELHDMHAPPSPAKTGTAEQITA